MPNDNFEYCFRNRIKKLRKNISSIFEHWFKSNVKIERLENNSKSDLEFYRYKMPKSRKAEYCLGCYDGSVFIDFKIKSGCLYLERISFDGFGCYEIDGRENLLSKEESKILKKEIYSKEMNNEIVKTLVVKLLQMNQDRIDDDVLNKYDKLK